MALARLPYVRVHANRSIHDITMSDIWPPPPVFIFGGAGGYSPSPPSAAAVSKVSADVLLAKALNIRRTKAGGLFKDVRAIHAIKLTVNDIFAWVRHHSAAYFYDTSYNHTKQHGPIPVDLNGRCVIS